jgi:hypothetical protein
VHVRRWLLALLPLAVAGAAAWKEYPALVRYWRIRQM